MRTLDDLIAEGVAGRGVLVRLDLNTPLAPDAGGVLTVTDDGRIRAAVPTVRALAEAGARVVACSHLGRPTGVDPAASLAPVAARLSELLGRPVQAASDVAGPDAQARAASLGAGDVLLLENLRFEPGETSKDPAEVEALAGRLAALVAARAEAGREAAPPGAYVDDAFGVLHRAHASVSGVPRLLPSYAGWLVVEELAVLRGLTERPEAPYVMVLGGSKVSDKLAVIEALLPQVDRLLVGGGMCFTFLAAQGHEVGTSLLEPDQVQTCGRLLAEAGERIVLPVDVVAAAGFGSDAEHATVAADAIPADRMGLDIGARTVAAFADVLAGARTVFWNGPMGVFELPPFAAGTRGVAEAVAAATAHAMTVVGGGDSAAAVRVLGLDEGAFTHISTGGGASLELLEGTALPGLTALESAPAG